MRCSQLTVLCPEGGHLTRPDPFNCPRALGTLARDRQSRGVRWMAAKDTRAPHVCTISPPGSTSAWEGGRGRPQCLLGGAQQTQHVTRGACRERGSEEKMAPSSWRRAREGGRTLPHPPSPPPRRPGLRTRVGSGASPSRCCSETSKGPGSPRPATSAPGAGAFQPDPVKRVLRSLFLGGSPRREILSPCQS